MQWVKGGAAYSSQHQSACELGQVAVNSWSVNPASTLLTASPLVTAFAPNIPTSWLPSQEKAFLRGSHATNASDCSAIAAIRNFKAVREPLSEGNHHFGEWRGRRDRKDYEPGRPARI
jgi:hypothetical protein